MTDTTKLEDVPRGWWRVAIGSQVWHQYKIHIREDDQQQKTISRK